MFGSSIPQQHLTGIGAAKDESRMKGGNVTDRTSDLGKCRVSTFIRR